MDLDREVMVAQQLADTGHSDDALQRLHRVLSVDPDHVEALAAAAFAYPQPARNDEAVRAARRAAGLTGAPREMVNLALILTHTGEPALLAEGQRLAASQLPLVDGDPSYLSLIAFCHQAGDYEAAYRLAQQAEALQPDQAALTLIAGVYAADPSRGRQDDSHDRAERIYRWLLSIDPHNDTAHRGLTSLMLAQERIADAFGAASTGARTAPQRMGTMPAAVAFGVITAVAILWLLANLGSVLLAGLRTADPGGLLPAAFSVVIVVVGAGMLAFQIRRHGWATVRRGVKGAARLHPMVAWLPVLLLPLPWLLHWARATWADDPGPALSLLFFTLGTALFFPLSDHQAQRARVIDDHPGVLFAYLVRRAAWVGVVAWLTMSIQGAAVGTWVVLALAAALVFFGLIWPGVFYRRTAAARQVLGVARARPARAALALATVVLFGLALVRAALPMAAEVAVALGLVVVLILATVWLRAEVRMTS